MFVSETGERGRQWNSFIYRQAYRQEKKKESAIGERKEKEKATRTTLIVVLLWVAAVLFSQVFHFNPDCRERGVSGRHVCRHRCIPRSEDEVSVPCERLRNHVAGLRGVGSHFKRVGVEQPPSRRLRPRLRFWPQRERWRPDLSLLRWDVTENFPFQLTPSLTKPAP